jgi:hypothetical protein
MQRFIRVTSTGATRPGQLAAAAALVAAVAAAGALAAPGHAASTLGAGKTGHSRSASGFERPRLHARQLDIVGTEGSDKIALRLEHGRPDELQVDVGDDGSPDFSFHRESFDAIVVDARGGDDVVRIDDSAGAFTDTIRTTIAGGDGNDTLIGGAGAELFFGGDGNDTIDGNGGNDVAFMGSGDDRFVWDPGDGSDTINGEAGSDTMTFNGAAGAEQVTLSGNGSRLKFFRVQGNVTMDTVGVERVDFNALGGADTVTVNDLTGTDVSSVDVDLASSLGGASGDGAADRVVVNGTNGDDAITVNGDAGGVKASGLAATVKIVHSEAANDRLEVNTLDGKNTVDSAGLAAGAIKLFVNGTLVP